MDRAHQLGLGVILDVVYNHLGPDGNYLKAFSPAYFTDKYKTEWGEAINFDGPDSGPVRDFFASNAAYWIDEFHLDGLRLDATQNIYDDAPDPAKHILAEIGRRVRAAAKGRSTIVVNENEPQHPRLVRPLDQGGYRPGRTVERRLPPLGDGRPDRPERGVLLGLPRHGPGVHLGGQVRLPVPGAVVLLAGEAPRASRVSTCRRPRSSRSSRTTTRSPTPAAGCGPIS